MKIVTELNENEDQEYVIFSPPRKRKTHETVTSETKAYSAALLSPFNNPVLPIKDVHLHNNHLAAKSVKSNKVKLNVASSKSEVVLKTLNVDPSEFSCFTAKHRANGSMDFVFDSVTKAEKAQLSLKKKLDTVDLDNMSITGMTKWNVVGLPYSVYVNEALESLVACNSELGFTCYKSPTFKNCITVNDVDGPIMKLIDVRRCRNGQYRLIISTNDEMTDLIKNTNLKIMNVICRKYKIPAHDRCYNCNQRGHFKAQCKNDTACAFCAGNHETWSSDCSAVTPTCINCIRNKHDSCNHAVYSHLCPLNNHDS